MHLTKKSVNGHNLAHGFTSKELWFLFNQVAPVTVIGFSDPTLGFLREEKLETARQEQNHLLTKHIIEVSPDFDIIVKEPVASWLDIIAKSNHVLMLVCQDAKSPEKIYSFHLNNSKIIRLVSADIENYEIDETESLHIVQKIAMAPLVKTVYLQREDEAIVLPNKILSAVYSHLENKQIPLARKVLGNFFKNEARLEFFIQALLEPFSRLSMIAFLQRDQLNLSETIGFSVVAGSADLWLFKPTGKKYDFVQITTISKSYLEEMIQTTLRRLEALI
jgi:hypothetical protein